MGCDIHTMLERKRTINGEQEWVNIDHWKLNPYFGTDESERKLERIEFYGGRNYNLFAVLAGVRNGANVTPISEPKGIPKDCSLVVDEEYTRWGCDAHTPSYFSLKELMDFYNKNKVQKRKGMLSKEQCIRLDIFNEKPNSWCGWTSVEDFEMREWEDESSLIYFIKPLMTRAKEELWIYNDEDNSKLYQQSENIRVVFWFDN